MPAASDATFDVIDPGTEVVIGQVAEASATDVDAAVRAARRAFDEERWLRLSPAQRAVVLWRVADLVEARIDELARLESLDVGVPVSQAKLMVAEAVNQFRYYAGWADKIQGTTVEIGPADRRMQGATYREPVGVVAMIVPWNAPLIAMSMKLAPALAAGCACILKPSEEAPLSALALGRILTEAGVPAGVVNIVTGFGATGAAMAEHPGIDKISFTGSTEVGRRIVAAATGNLKKVSLELGGKSPVIVLPDADLAAAAAGIALGVFWNSGQICTSGTRLFAHADIYEELIEGIADQGRAMKMGYGTDPDVVLGPLISRRQLDRVAGYVDGGIAAGARVISGGRRVGRTGFFFEPTVIADASPEMAIVREEIFGPVLAALSFTDLDEAIASANDTEYGLAGSIWTRDVALAHRIARRLRAGRIGVNVHRAGGVQMPVGGFKQSGWGRENGPDALEQYLETKSVVTLIDR
ncbi:aldehyde dehydrogenase family protein [Nocardia cyriacigeorgica]|uniref:aldehyde dehydrogenase family protein n=1 Tax=Nocardia cyriacigeorgica TaxID=135487 RepID=UPI0024577B72|nr:aldehyde dehydrogenase family protein [Nocardia cyriacigeorgica]